MNELFQEELITAAKDRQNYGELPDADDEATSFNASCGDSVTVKLKYDKKQAIIAELKWTGNGCIISQAAMSILSAAVIGKEVMEVKKLRIEDVLGLMHLKNITPGRTRCLVLGLSTLQQALNSNNLQ